jgi:hypothetical protein
MPKSRTQRLDVKEFVSLVKESEFLTPVELRKVRSLIDARIKVTGKFSGQDYLFPQAGAVQDVDARDVEWLLAKRQGERQCCGGTERGNKVFELVEE